MEREPVSKQLEFKRVSVIGLGYIGLPTAALFASRGTSVIGVDIDPHTVDTVNRGDVHIVEPGLKAVVHAAVAKGLLRATAVPEAADAFLIAVPTPFDHDHAPDLRHVRAAAESIAPVLKKGDIVILESTSPVGSTERMAQWLAAVRPDLRFPMPGAGATDVHVAYCPERVLPGRVLRELVENDRIIGGLSAACSRRAAEVYRLFVKGEMLFTDARTAEMSKLAENAFRDVNIAFANELSLISDRLGIDVWELIRLANHHPRVNILSPGCGVGGHCIAVDPWFIIDQAPREARLIRAAREVNDHKPQWVLGRIKAAVDALIAAGRDEATIRIALFGLAFKPDIDDLRESPALQIAERLARQGHARLLLVEPNIDTVPPTLAGHVLSTVEEATACADIIVFLVRHREFKGVAKRIGGTASIIDAVGMEACR